MNLFWQALVYFNFVVLAYFTVLNLSYFLMTFLALGKVRAYAKMQQNLAIEEMIGNVVWPPVTLIAPAYNEESTCVESARSLMSLVYPEFEVIFVNDGSTDGTVRRMTEAFDMVETVRVPVSFLATAKVRKVYRSRKQPGLWLVDKENGGKADALNCGINYCQSPLFCVMDADSLLEREALKKIVRPFVEDTSTVAVGGIIRIANGCRIDAGVVTQVGMPRNWLAKFQVLEYLRAFLAGRMGWSAMDATLIVSGAFGVFQRGAVAAAGGFRRGTVGEDMELIVRLHRYCREARRPYRIIFVPDPVAWTECPETFAALGLQRDRWQRGLIESLLFHSKMLFNPLYGRIGLFAYPYFFFLEMLGPILETAGYFTFAACWLTGRISPLFAAAFLAVALVLGVALSVAAVSLEELSYRRYPKLSDILQLFALSILENFGYRQLQMFWRVKGFVSFLAGAKSWGTMERKGFSRISAFLLGAFLIFQSSVFAALNPEAEKAILNKDFGKAEQIYADEIRKEEIGKRGASRDARFGLARAQAYGGKFRESLALHDQILKENPKDVEARLSRGRVRAWSGDFVKAEEDLKESLQAQPENADGWSALGDLYAWWGRVDAALDAYAKQGELDRQNPMVPAAQAKVLMSVRRFAEARELLYLARKRGADPERVDELLRALDRIPSSKPWQASLIADHQSFSSDREEWLEFRAALKREFPLGSLALEGIRARRFGSWERAVAADGYLNLWKRAYVNARYLGGVSSTFLPHDETLVELFQGFGQGWEASAGHRYFAFNSDRVTRLGAGLGKYWGRWFLRAKVSAVPEAAGTGYSVSESARYYYGTVDDFAELSNANGKSVSDKTEFSIAARVQKFFLPYLGAGLFFNYSETESAPAQRGIAFQILSRW